jgi:hypothetical protein
VANLKIKSFEIVKITQTTWILFRFQYHHIEISFLIAIQIENKIFINLCLFEIYNKFAFWDIVSVQTPKLLHILLRYRRRTLCVFTWMISVADCQV